MELIEKYKKCSKDLGLKKRYLDIFDFRHSLSDGEKHSFEECGRKFGVSGERARQIVARVEYEVKKYSE